MKNLRIEIISAFDLIDYTVFRDYTEQEIESQPHLTSDEKLQGRMVATFQDKEIAESFVELYEQNKSFTGRPVKVHKFLSESWSKTSFWNKKIIPAIGIKTESGSIQLPFDSWKEETQKAEDIANAIVQIPNLIQIAEMSFDRMTSNGEQNSLPYQVTLNTLNQL